MSPPNAKKCRWRELRFLRGNPPPKRASPAAAIFAPPCARRSLPSSPRSRKHPPAAAFSPPISTPPASRTPINWAAAAISVLTDTPYFQGKLVDLEAARAAIQLPALRKDFTIAPSQIVEAAAHSADAILLIAAILTERELRDFRELAARYHMAALVEVHNRVELEAAIASGAGLIGVNNRDLTTFEVTLETSLRLAEHMPSGALLVSESGIHDARDIATLRAAGFHAFLVGEHLMKSGDPSSALRKLVAA